ncbi:hypothetical protein [Paraherbaspirillum soli]|uniref:Uncharacterized protein n=1 Tax=Paraherbaspirillum soli TaxID=631222 RepID=A0ABW0MF19_9BURK
MMTQSPAEPPEPVALAAEQQAGTNPEPLPLLPVILQFKDVASNSNINFTFTTVGVVWSLGARSGDSVGFSYNVAPESADSDSCIKKIEFNNAVLSIRTGEVDQASNAFTLTLFLQVAPKVDYLQGYCTLNNEAVVTVTIGAQGAVQWRNGRISAVLVQHGKNYRKLSFIVKGARAGVKVDLMVNAKRGLGKVNWSLGPNFSDAGGVRLASTHGGVLPLASMSYGFDTVSFITAAPADGATSGNGGDPLEFYLNTYIAWYPEDLNYIYLRTSCDSSVTVLAQVGNRQPQIVSQTDTVFTL